ncbi:tripartite tricarboxylate transporter substrate binding protein (plasmid) [Cupriavidus sp. KK10]|jgi:tripartite-type tricarboxylate transporter receptor subunit TctC|uniref:Bug family tripartite tricarboxylate transporter substrate binding protein n=1 Tax=Cupriavidus sp. KK10 TaxID=1478019 RepID=UPI001BA4AC26|nr:tripartite tricarboxylate transporter substrate binding protein [Cupriavidus sp. KK10]QUN32795.1 tripartite tricarboxylate transporter substrate binding protein [Cupriavidus sp. KK10]
MTLFNSLKKWCLAVFGAWLVLAAPAFAQAYPERPVKIISVSSAGTGADAYTRLLAKHLSDKLGQSFLVDNRPGGNMMVASEFVAKAAPDGYTLLLATSGTMAANPFLFKRLPYDPRKDFVPIARLSMLPVALVVPAGSPYRSVSDLVAAARAKPGKLNYGSASAPSQATLAAFNEAAHIQAVSVPYKGMAGMLTDLMGGVLDYGLADTASAVPQIQGKKLRALAVFSPSRVALMPDVPTLAEAGVPGVLVASWTGLFAPAGTPAAIVDKLSRLCIEFAGSPQAQAHYAERGTLAFPAAGPELARGIVEDQKMWKRLITIAGIQPE